jgi:hypothetical protein
MDTKIIGAQHGAAARAKRAAIPLSSFALTSIKIR